VPEGDFVAGVGIVLFLIGFGGLLFRRNLLVMLLSLELMLNGVNLLFVVGSRLHHNLDGQMMTLFVIAVAAGEVAVGLGILLVLYRRRKTLDLEKYTLLKH